MSPRRPSVLEPTSPHAELSLLVVTPTQVFPVALGAGVFTVGRSPEASLPLDDEGLAPLHLSLRSREEGLELEALGGHAALLNEVQLSGPSLARPGDQIGIGTTSLVVLKLSRGADRPLQVLGEEAFDAVLKTELGRPHAHERPLALWLLDSPSAEPHAREELWRVLGPLLPNAVVGTLGPRTLQLLLLDTNTGESAARVGRASTLLGRAGIRFAFGVAHAPLDAQEPAALRERALTELESEPGPEEDPIQVDPVMGRLFGLAERLGRSGDRVHLIGEAGVGKETLARLIHQRGRFADGPFVRLDARACAEGELEQAVAHAQGGTLFVRGAERLAPKRAIEVPDGQLITSSRTSAPTDARAILVLPPLRERPTELLALADAFLTRFARTLGRERRVLSAPARRLVAEGSWEGNVRALRLAMAHAVLATRGPEVQPEALPASLLRASRGGGPARNDLRGALKAAEREALLSALAATSWNVTRAAEQLSLPRRTVVYRMSRLGLKRPGR